MVESNAAARQSAADPDATSGGRRGIVVLLSPENMYWNLNDVPFPKVGTVHNAFAVDGIVTVQPGKTYHVRAVLAHVGFGLDRRGRRVDRQQSPDAVTPRTRSAIGHGASSDRSRESPVVCPSQGAGGGVAGPPWEQDHRCGGPHMYTTPLPLRRSASHAVFRPL